MLKKCLKITIFILILIILICNILNLSELIKDDERIATSTNKKFEDKIINVEITKNENIEATNHVLENTQEIANTTSIQEVTKNVNTKSNTNKVSTEVEKQQVTSKIESEVIKNNIVKSETTIKSNEESKKTSEESTKINEQIIEKQEETIMPDVNVDNSTKKDTSEEIEKEIKEEKKNIESFKVNNSVIEKIKTIINNNPSSTMQQFGYNIVVDSSIVNQTTGFTFTETRVKNAIKFSFGTIKIYARDYYVDDELRWIECFIL